MSLSVARLEMVRMVREHCSQLAGVPGDESGTTYLRELASRALEVPIETMAGWFVLSDTMLANMRLAMTMVEQNYEQAKAYARATGSVEVTYDGVTYTRSVVRS